MTHSNHEAHFARYAFIEGIIADGRLSRGELAVALSLAMHKNLKSGQCNPSVATIAKSAAMTTRNVQYALAGLEQKGRIKRHMRPGTSTQYDLLAGAKPVAPPSPAEGVKKNDEGAKSEAVGGEKTEPKGCNAFHPNLENLEENIGTVCVDPPTSDVEILDEKEVGTPSEAQIEDSFEEFWRQYPKKVGYGQALTAYAKVVSNGEATIAQLLHAVMLFAEARTEADQDEYTWTPTRWLNEKGWRDDPAAHALGSARGGFAKRLWKHLRNRGFADAAGHSAYHGQEARQRAQDEERERGIHADHCLRWRRVHAALAEELGEEIMKRFFSKIEFEHFTGEIIYLKTLAPYDARQITRLYGEHLLKHWKVELPGVRSVQLLIGRVRRTA